MSSSSSLCLHRTTATLSVFFQEEDVSLLSDSFVDLCGAEGDAVGYSPQCQAVSRSAAHHFTRPNLDEAGDAVSQVATLD